MAKHLFTYEEVIEMANKIADERNELRSENIELKKEINFLREMREDETTLKKKYKRDAEEASQKVSSLELENLLLKDLLAEVIQLAEDAALKADLYAAQLGLNELKKVRKIQKSIKEDLPDPLEIKLKEEVKTSNSSESKRSKIDLKEAQRRINELKKSKLNILA